MRKLVIAGVVLVSVATLAGLVVNGVYRVRLAAAKTTINSLLGTLYHSVDVAHQQHRRLPPVIGTLWKNHGALHYHIIPFVESRMTLPPLEVNDPYSAFYVSYDPSLPEPENMTWEDKYSFTNFPANWLAFHGGPTIDGKTTWEHSFPDGRGNTVLFAMRYAMCNGTPTLWGYDKLDPKAPMIGYFSTDRFQVMPTQVECDPKLANTWLPSMGVVMADGSVRWVGPGVSAATWRSALHPADGEKLGIDWEQ